MRPGRRFGRLLLNWFLACSLVSSAFSASLPSVSASPAASSSSSRLRIASFNIQVLGPSKVSNPFVLETLAKILQRYDMSFIQEIRDSDTHAIDTLLAAVNQGRAIPYELALSERLGRSVSKEQYAFIYDPRRVELLDVKTFQDSDDAFEREPYLGRFRAGAVDFSVIGIHVTPRAVAAELQSLQAVYREVKTEWRDPDILLMGDFNADCAYYKASLGFDYFDESPFEVLPPGTDTTVAPALCTYDRVLAFGPLAEQLSEGGAFNFQEAYGLSLEEARSVSDHYPVEFTLHSRDEDGLDAEQKTQSSVPLPPALPPLPPATQPLPPLPAPSASSESKSCGASPYKTPRGYCYASFGAMKKRVAGSCCVLLEL